MIRDRSEAERIAAMAADERRATVEAVARLVRITAAAQPRSHDVTLLAPLSGPVITIARWGKPPSSGAAAAARIGRCLVDVAEMVRAWASAAVRALVALSAPVEPSPAEPAPPQHRERANGPAPPRPVLLAGDIVTTGPPALARRAPQHRGEMARAA